MDDRFIMNTSDNVLRVFSDSDNASYSIRHGYAKGSVQLKNSSVIQNVHQNSSLISDDIIEDYYNNNNDYPYQMITKSWQVPIFAYVYSGICLLTILVNILVIYVFAFKRMRSQTTLMLSSLACSDSIICLSVAVYHIYFHLLENYKKPVKHQWCIVQRVMYLLEQMARSSSNWITALLGVQRFVCICFPFRAKTLCSIRTSVIAVIFSVVVGITVYIYEAVSVKVVSWPVMNGSVYLYDGCILASADGVNQRSVMIHYILAGLITRVIPCLVMLFTTVLLARKLRQRQLNIGANVQDADKSSSKMNRLNVLVFVILVIFLVAELQDTIAFCIYVYELAVDKIKGVLSEEADDYWDTWGSMLSLLGYHCNFWIFFLMSAQFRSAFYEACMPFRTAYSSVRTTTMTTDISIINESSRPFR